MTGTYLTDTVGLPASIMNNQWFVIGAFIVLAIFIIMIFFVILTKMLMTDTSKK
jgi:hypothetical protein